MEFKLNEYHRNVSDEELIADIRRVASQLELTTLTKKEYNAHGKYSADTIANRFGSWNKAIELAGLSIRKSFHRNPYNKCVTDEDLICDIISVCNDLNVDTITSTEYEKNGKHGRRLIIKRFGSWKNALEKASLNQTGYRRNIRDEELMDDIENMWINLGRQPTTTDIKNGYSSFSLNTFSRRFGSWRNALESFIMYVNEEDKTSTTDKKENGVVETKTEIENKKKYHNTMRDVNLRLRFRVMQRDNFKCCICGASPAKDPTVELQIDHIIPWSKGGETVMDNLQTLCSKCNLGKSDLL